MKGKICDKILSAISSLDEFDDEIYHFKYTGNIKTEEIYIK